MKGGSSWSWRKPIVSRLALAGALVISQLAHAQVTLDHPTADVEKVVAALSQSAGEPHRAPGFDREFILVSVTDVPAEELRAKIAEVVGAEWRKDEQGWLLFRSREKERELIAHDIEAQRPALEKHLGQIAPPPESQDIEELQRLVDDAEAISGLDSRQVSTAATQLRNRTPMNRAMHAIIAQIPVERLLSIRPGERRVFSLDPTPRQERLPAICADLMARAQRDTEWINGRLPDDDAARYSSPIFTNLPTQPQDWFIAVEPEGFGNLSVRLYTVHSSGSASMQFYWSFNKMADLPEAPPTDLNDQTFELTVLDRLILPFFQQAMAQQTPRLDLPPGTEPYSLLLETALKALAKSEDRDLVARPDLMMWAYSIFVIGHQTAPAISGIKAALTNAAAETKRDGTWLTVTPALSVLATEEPKRDALDAFFRLHAENALEAYAFTRIVAQSKCRSNINFLGWFSTLAQSRLAPNFGQGEWLGARAIGMLQVRDMDKLRSGEQLQIGRASQAVRQAMEDWLYSDLVGSATEQMAAMRDARMGLFNPSEPTIVFPRGLPDDAILEMQRLESAEYVLKLRMGSFEREQSVSESTLAYYLEDTSPDRAVVTGLYPVSVTTEMVILRSGPYYRQYALRSETAPEGREFKPYSSLPDDVRARIEEIRRMMRESIRNRNTPPPSQRP